MQCSHLLKLDSLAISKYDSKRVGNSSRICARTYTIDTLPQFIGISNFFLGRFYVDTPMFFASPWVHDCRARKWKEYYQDCWLGSSHSQKYISVVTPSPMQRKAPTCQRETLKKMWKVNQTRMVRSCKHHPWDYFRDKFWRKDKKMFLILIYYRSWHFCETCRVKNTMRCFVVC